MATFDADPRYGRFGLRTDCPRCGAHLPVNGLVDQVGCADCGHHTPIPVGILLDLVRDFEEQFPHPRSGGTAVHQDLTFRWTAHAVDAPVCTACSEALPPDTLADVDPSSDDAVRCPSCQASQTISPLLPAVDHKVKSAQLVIGGNTDLTRPDVHRDPVALQCPQCGGGLSISQDRERITPCDYCGTQVHLPDAVWRALHPPREVEEWVVRFTGPSPEAIRRKKAESQRQREEEKARQKAEARAKKQARKAEQKRREKEARAAKAARAKVERARQARWDQVRSVVAIAAQIGIMAITVGFSSLAMLSVLAYASPETIAKSGVPIDASAFLGTTLLGVSGAGLVFCWFLGVLAAIFRAKIPAWGTFFQSAVHLFIACLPLIGAPVAWFFAVAHALGSFPRPPGKEFEGYKGPLGNGLPIALTLAVLPVFATVACAVVFDMTIWEMLERLGDD